MTTFAERGRLLDAGEIKRAVTRIAHELLERNKGAGRLVLVGIAARGDDLARRLAAEIRRDEDVQVRLAEVDGEDAVVVGERTREGAPAAAGGERERG